MRALIGPFLDLRIADAVDILLVTVLLYTAVIWIRRTQAVLVAVGILLLGLLYVAARGLGLQLTAWLFQGFFAIFLIIIVVIFQEELRQLFERLAVLGLRRGRPAPVHSTPVDVLVQCLADFARDRVGALVVLPGKQPLSRHVRGGIELGGRVSVPLLKSIFDHHSPGHDGAVILEGDRISRFAVHLPLSSDFRQLAGTGTRHTAALGLAELTDAICLVVSEERGQVSVAQGGRLERLADPRQLGDVLQTRLAAVQPSRALRPALTQLIRENWVEKLASFAVVVGLWSLLVPGARPTAATYSVPVRVVNVPEGRVLEEVSPDVVEVTFSGPARAFYFFDRGQLAATIDATLARLGRRTFEIPEDSFRRPAALDIEDIRPGRVKISLRQDDGGEASDGETP